MSPIKCPDCTKYILFEEIKQLQLERHLLTSCYPTALYLFLEKNFGRYQECPNDECSNVIRFDDGMRKCELCNSEIEFNKHPTQYRYCPTQENDSFDSGNILDFDDDGEQMLDNNQGAVDCALILAS